MSSASAIKAIKYSIDNRNFDEALKLLEELVRTPEGSTCANYSTLGNCALQLKQTSKAIAALEKSLELNPPVENIQKLWKTLSDLYEEAASWEKHANAQTKLYEILLQKGNMDRVSQLAEVITSSFQKAKKFEASVVFATNHIEVAGLSSVEHMDKILACVNQCQCAFIEQVTQTKRPGSRLSIGSAQKDQVSAAAAELDATWLSPEPFAKRFIDSHSSVNPIGPLNADIAQLLTRHLKDLRADAMSQPARGSWANVFSFALATMTMTITADPTCSVVSHLIEAWFFCSEIPFTSISTVIDTVLQQYPSQPSATLARAFGSLEQGFLRSARSDLSICTSIWANQPAATLGGIPATTVASTSIKLTESLDNSIFTLNLFVIAIGGGLDGFRGLAVQEQLHIVEEAKRREASVSKSFGRLRSNIRELILLSRLRAFAAISQCEIAYNEGPKTLPGIFQKPSSSATKLDVKEDSIAFTTANTTIMALQWMLVALLNDLSLHDLALRCIDKILTAGPLVSSWLLAQKGISQLNSALNFVSLAKRAEGFCHSPTSFTALELRVSDQAAVGASVRTLQAALSAGDLVAAHIDPDVRVHMGIAMWLAGGKLRSDKSGCIAYLLNGAKGEPTHRKVYTYIGHFYFIENNDLDRAEKCYLKALGLDPLNEEAGYGLSQIYLKQGLTEKALKLWTDVASLTTHASWCHSIRGRFHLHLNEFENAVDFLQRALELNTEDANGWYSLGVSYACLRQTPAAHKALLRAAELAPNDLVVQCALGDVERKQCLLVDALRRYEFVLTRSPADIIALKGVADTCLLLAYERNTSGWTGGAGRIVLKGISSIDKIISAGSSAFGSQIQHKCLWKLLGDLCCFVQHLGPQDVLTDSVTTYSNSDSTTKTGSGSGPAVALPTFEPLLAVLRKGEHAYKRVVDSYLQDSNSQPRELSSLTGDELDALAIAWYDLGAARYYQARSTMQSRGQGSGLTATSDIVDDHVRSLYGAAKDAFTAGIQCNPLHSGCWNGLGLSILDNARTQQACFVRATQIDSCPAAYANLGLLLISHNQYEAAKDCFSAVQLIESNPLVWISLGTIFERTASNVPTGSAGSGSHTSTVASHSMLASHDSYIAALEIAKPTDALIGSALSWLRINGNLTDLILSPTTLASPEHMPSLGARARADQPSAAAPASAPGSKHGRKRGAPAETSAALNSGTNLHDMRHNSEELLAQFVHRRPVHPMAWAVLAWTLEARGALQRAQGACRAGLQALEVIAKALHTSHTTQPSAVSAAVAGKKAEDKDGKKDGEKVRQREAMAARFAKATLLFLKSFRRCGYKLLFSFDIREERPSSTPLDISEAEFNSLTYLKSLTSLSLTAALQSLTEFPIVPLLVDSAKLSSWVELAAKIASSVHVQPSGVAVSVGVGGSSGDRALANSSGPPVMKTIAEICSAVKSGHLIPAATVVEHLCTYFAAVPCDANSSAALTAFLQCIYSVLHVVDNIDFRGRVVSAVCGFVDASAVLQHHPTGNNDSELLSSPLSSPQLPMGLFLRRASNIVLGSHCLLRGGRDYDARRLLKIGTLLFPRNAVMWTLFAEACTRLASVRTLGGSDSSSSGGYTIHDSASTTQDHLDSLNSWELTVEAASGANMALLLARRTLLSHRDANDGMGIVQMASDEAEQEPTNSIASVTEAFARAAAVKVTIAVHEGIPSTSFSIFPWTVEDPFSRCDSSSDHPSLPDLSGSTTTISSSSTSSKAKGRGKKNAIAAAHNSTTSLSQSMRLELLRGLHGDPGNVAAWAALALGSFSDAVLQAGVEAEVTETRRQNIRTATSRAAGKGTVVAADVRAEDPTVVDSEIALNSGNSTRGPDTGAAVVGGYEDGDEDGIGGEDDAFVAAVTAVVDEGGDDGDDDDGRGALPVYASAGVSRSSMHSSNTASSIAALTSLRVHLTARISLFLLHGHYRRQTCVSWQHSERGHEAAKLHSQDGGLTTGAASSAATTDIESLDDILQLLMNPRHRARSLRGTEVPVGQPATGGIEDALTAADSARAAGRNAAAADGYKKGIKLLEDFLGVKEGYKIVSPATPAGGGTPAAVTAAVTGAGTGAVTGAGVAPEGGRVDSQQSNIRILAEEQLCLAWRSLGNIYAHQLQPSQAEYCYKASSAAVMVSSSSAKKSIAGLQTRVLNTVLAALAYYKRHCIERQRSDGDRSQAATEAVVEQTGWGEEEVHESASMDDSSSNSDSNSNSSSGSCGGASSIVSGVSSAKKVRSLLNSASAIIGLIVDSDAASNVQVTTSVAQSIGSESKRPSRALAAVEALKAAVLVTMGPEMSGKAREAATLAVNYWPSIDLSLFAGVLESMALK